MINISNCLTKIVKVILIIRNQPTNKTEKNGDNEETIEKSYD